MEIENINNIIECILAELSYFDLFLLINLDVRPSLISFLYTVHTCSSFGLGTEGNISYDGVRQDRAGPEV